ncbi:hypothetical protein ES703_69349 [subsurface metagenome]
MGKKNRERVAKIRAGIEKSIATPTDPQEKARLGICPFPGCKEKPLRAEGAHGFCARHESFLADLLFILPYLTSEPDKRPGGLILPGSPEFSVLPKNTG